MKTLLEERELLAECLRKCWKIFPNYEVKGEGCLRRVKVRRNACSNWHSITLEEFEDNRTLDRFKEQVKIL